MVGTNINHIKKMSKLKNPSFLTGLNNTLNKSEIINNTYNQEHILNNIYNHEPNSLLTD